MPNQIDTADFLLKLKQSDPSAFETLVRAYTGQIYNASRGLGFNKVDADDLTQNVWITFFDVVKNFEGRSKIKTFLFGILYNKASELRKKSQRIDISVDIEDILEKKFDSHGHWLVEPKDPEAFLNTAQSLQLISECMDLLPLNQKLAFNLKEIEDDTTENICTILDVTSTNLGVLLFRARNQLRDCIEKKTK